MSLATKQRVCFIIVVVGIVNFLVFVVIASLIGGDAVNGHETGGRYFVANHDRYTEVSHSVFVYSRIHVYTLFCTWRLQKKFMPGHYVLHCEMPITNTELTHADVGMVREIEIKE